jgi:hypothetical protein
METKGYLELSELYSSIYNDVSESHYKVGDKVLSKSGGMKGEVVKVDSEESGDYYTVKSEDGKTAKYAPDELKKSNGGVPKEKEEKFHTKLDTLVHKTFGKSPEEQKEETDLFVDILEYLIAEGYADTNENALAIMENMSEEWKESIVEEVLDEGYKEFPKGKVDKKMASKAVRATKHQVAATWGDKNKSSENQEKANKLGSQAKKLAQISTEKNKEANSRSRGVQSKHKSEVKRKIRYMDDIVRQQKERGYGGYKKD